MVDLQRALIAEQKVGYNHYRLYRAEIMFFPMPSERLLLNSTLPEKKLMEVMALAWRT